MRPWPRRATWSRPINVDEDNRPGDLHPPGRRPRVPEKARAEEPLTAVASLGVAAITGVAVFAAGVYVAERWSGARPHAPASQASSATPAGTPTATASPTPPAPASMTSPPYGPTAALPEVPPMAQTPQAPQMPPTPPTPAATLAPTAAPTTQPALQPARAGYGSLKVLSSLEATVYVNGIAVGPTNLPVEVRCGRFFIRLGTPSPHGTQWLQPGKTVVVDCEAKNEVTF